MTHVCEGGKSLLCFTCICVVSSVSPFVSVRSVKQLILPMSVGCLKQTAILYEAAAGNKLYSLFDHHYGEGS